jgi:hypothetical protein
MACVLGLEGPNSIDYNIEYLFVDVGQRADEIYACESLCVKTSELLRIPWVAFVFASLFVLESIRSSRYYFYDDVGS